MSSGRHRVLFIASNPVQYASPMFRRMAQHPKLDIQVAYCSLQGAESGKDPEFGVDVKWDIPLLEGYPWVLVPNKSMRPALGKFWGLINLGLWRLIGSGDYDAIVVYTGYACASFWIAMAAAKFYRRALFFGTDAHGLTPRDGKKWKAGLKRIVWPRLFSLADIVIVPSTPSIAMMRSLGIPEERLALTPYVVDNDWWIEQSALADRDAVRAAWGVPKDATVVLFCAKLQPWKRPVDLLRAFVKANVANSHLVYAGDGPLRQEVASVASSLDVLKRIHFIGFTNQSQLPAVYRASDLMVLPSEYDAFGVVVNEAMLCGCAIAVSDRVGAGYDLVSGGENGYVFPCGDVERLAGVLEHALSDPPRLRLMGERARTRIDTWSPTQNIQALIGALDRVPARTRPQEALL